MAEVTWGGQDWVLRADRSVYWPSRKTLILADPHFGKASTFRAAGVPVPSGTTKHILDRIDEALKATGADRLIVLGDFFHSKIGVSDDLLEQLRIWRQRWDGLTLCNIRGNHDRQAGDPPEELKIDCCPEPLIERQGGEDSPIAFTHEPQTMKDASVLSGHLHPAIKLSGPGGDHLRMACFWFTPSVAVLPAFGAFTGMAPIKPSAGDLVFAVGPTSVTKVVGSGTTMPGRGRRRRRQPRGMAAGEFKQRAD